MSLEWNWLIAGTIDPLNLLNPGKIYPNIKPQHIKKEQLTGVTPTHGKGDGHGH